MVSRQKTDLRLSEVRMQKLKEELRLTESQSASYRVNIAKFNGEVSYTFLLELILNYILLFFRSKKCKAAWIRILSCSDYICANGRRLNN